MLTVLKTAATAGALLIASAVTASAVTFDLTTGPVNFESGPSLSVT